MIKTIRRVATNRPAMQTLLAHHGAHSSRVENERSVDILSDGCIRGIRKASGVHMWRGSIIRIAAEHRHFRGTYRAGRRHRLVLNWVDFSTGASGQLLWGGSLGSESHSKRRFDID